MKLICIFLLTLFTNICTYSSPIFKQELVNIEGKLGGFTMEKKWTEDKSGVLILNILLKSDEPRLLAPFKLKMNIPSQDVYTIFTSPTQSGRSNYHIHLYSRAASDLPLIAFINKKNQSKLTWMVSDNLNTIVTKVDVSEDNALFESEISFFSDKPPVEKVKEYQVQIRFDTRELPYEIALDEAVQWWRTVNKSKPAYAPPIAYKPVYSTWYNYHHKLDASELIKESNEASKLGMEVLIIDDGWMTLRDSLTFYHVGDYKPLRLPNMKEMVDSIHNNGMKVMLWYSTSMAGYESEASQKYAGNYIRDAKNFKTYIYDPRYPKVRENLIGLLTESLNKWEIDGFKLDFLAQMYPDDTTPNTMSGGRDFASIDKATAHWMKKTYDTLRSINPDILIEFRQPYVTPIMQQYGNMFRAIDNANMEIANRIYTTKLRLYSNKLPVHSDMVMWNLEDPVESAALQITNILFSVPQVSMRLSELGANHKKMIQFWLSYYKNNEELIMKGNFRAPNPGENFPSLTVFDHNKQITNLFGTPVVDLYSSDVKKLDIINSAHAEVVYIPLRTSRVNVEIKDCMGNILSSDKRKVINGTLKLNIPPTGMATLHW